MFDRVAKDTDHSGIATHKRGNPPLPIPRLAGFGRREMKNPLRFSSVPPTLAWIGLIAGRGVETPVIAAGISRNDAASRP